MRKPLCHNRVKLREHFHSALTILHFPTRVHKSPQPSRRLPAERPGAAAGDTNDAARKPSGGFRAAVTFI